MLINNMLLKLSVGSRGWICLCSFIEILYLSAITIKSFCIAKTIGSIATGDKKFYTYLLVIVICIFAEIILKKLNTNIIVMCEVKFKRNVRNRLLDHLNQLGTSYLNDSRTGQTLTTVIESVEAMGPYYSRYMPSLFGTIIISTSIIIYIFNINKTVAIIAIIGILGVLIVPAFWYKSLHSKGKGVWRVTAKFSADLLDNIQGMETLKNLKACSTRRKSLAKTSKNIHKKTMEHMAVTTIENLLLNFFAGLGASVSVGYAALLVTRGDMTASNLLIILFLSSCCFMPVNSLMNAWHLGFNGVSASETVFTMMNEKREMWIQNQDNHVPNNKKNSLVCENLVFGYDRKKSPVINDVSIELEEGKITAIVGKSGDGKSTLASVIAGLYPYWSGNISYAGVILNEDTLTSWRKRIAAVWQEPYLFNATLRENVRMGKEGATDEEILNALENANLLDVVNTLPDGLDTVVGEKGCRFSGGEKQRITIARCFLKEASLLIFDEATSSLDEKNQYEIQQSINRLMKGKTVLVIAHRLSTIEKADRIYMMKSGEILEYGTHEKLLKSCPEYRELIELQRRRENNE